MRYRDWGQVRRVLAVRLDGVGDVVTLGPALRALKAALPRAEVTLLSSPEGSQAVPLLPWVDDLLAHRALWQDPPPDGEIDVGAQVDLIELIEGRRFDAALIFTRAGHSPHPAAYVCYLAGIRIRVGQSTEAAGGVLTHLVRPMGDRAHQVDRDLYLLEASGFPVAGRQLELRVPAPARTSAANLLDRGGLPPDEPFVVLAPGAGAASRRYPADRYAEVCGLLGERTQLPVVLVGTPREVALAARIARAAPHARVVSITGQTSVPELAAVIERAALLVGNHASPMQLADALRRPQVVLYAGTEPEACARPRGSPARLLRAPTRCSPCRLQTCTVGLACLDVTPQAVVDEALTLLEAAAGGEAPATGGTPTAALPDHRPPAGRTA
ncbi:MAG TPA: glycosyltransferase family 9 protein [Actinomycetes bacterium]|nr:glycosyltransferase family 9 protein [Actinomycetes bacterium]